MQESLGVVTVIIIPVVGHTVARGRIRQDPSPGLFDPPAYVSITTLSCLQV